VATFLDLVNKVMVRLREPEVTSVSGSKYIKLIAQLVNDSKRAVEDAANWTALIDSVSVTTSSGTADYSLTDTNERTTIFSVVNDNDRAEIWRSNPRDVIKRKQTEQGNGKPDRWAIVGTDSSGQLKIRFSTTPNGAYDFTVNCYIPQDDLSATTDTLLVPSEPVYLRAYAYAIKERGEDNGQAFQEALDEYRRVLSRYLVLNNSAAGGNEQWRVV